MREFMDNRLHRITKITFRLNLSVMRRIACVNNASRTMATRRENYNVNYPFSRHWFGFSCGLCLSVCVLTFAYIG